MSDPERLETGGGLHFGVLGPARMLVGAREVDLGGPRQRGLLALFALQVNQVVSLDRIVDVLWGERPPATARTIVQGYVSRLRRLIETHAPGGDVTIITRPPGYLLAAETSVVDLHRARSLLRQARGRPAGERVELLAAAETLWHGPVLPELTELAVVSDIEDLRLAVISERIEAELELGRAVEVIGQLRTLLLEYPYFERGVAQLMLALYRSGRRAEALKCYRKFQHSVGVELGIDPGPALIRLYQRVLRDDPALAAAPAPRGPVVVPSQLPGADEHFTGRESEIAWLDGLLAAEARTGVNTVAVISGPAGAGKTALAVTWAHRVADRFAGGRLFAALRGFDRNHPPVPPEQVLTHFLLALGVAAADVPEELDERSAMYRSLLAERKVLLLLDDARDSEQIRPLIPGGGSLLLVTSRRRLGGLMASGGTRLLKLDTMSERDSMRVLAASGAGLAEPDARRISRLCDHLPLALRVVAARIATGSPDAATRVLAELSDERTRLGALHVEDFGTGVPAALQVSHRSLSEEGAAALTMIGVAPGPWIGGHALAAMSGSANSLAESALRELVAANLLAEPVAGRFAAHDLVRLYARECAATLPEQDRCSALHGLLRYYLVTGDRARRLLGPAIDGMDLTEEYQGTVGPTLDSAALVLGWFEAEWPNLLAVQRAAVVAGRHRQAWQLAKIAHAYRVVRPLPDDWPPLLILGMDSARVAGDIAGQVQMLVCRSTLRTRLAKGGDPVADAEEAFTLAARLGDAGLLRLCLSQLGAVLWDAGRFAESLRHSHELLARCEDDEAQLRAWVLNNVAQAELELGRLAEAVEHQREAVELDRRSGDQHSGALSAANLAEMLVLLGEFAEAERTARLAVAMAADRDLALAEAFGRQVLGLALRGRGADAAARAELEIALRRYLEIGSPRAAEVRAELARVAPTRRV
ncbi:MAG: BTAD domain-containing putative transcriptional regulator [Sciscionella sp.]